MNTTTTTTAAASWTDEQLCRLAASPTQMGRMARREMRRRAIARTA